MRDTGDTGATSTQTPAGAQLVTLEPVYVSSNRIGAMIAACRRHDIYFQFGPRRGHETVFFVLPADLDAAMHLAASVCGPLVGSGCKLPFLSILALFAIAAMVPLAGF